MFCTKSVHVSSCIRSWCFYVAVVLVSMLSIGSIVVIVAQPVYIPVFESALEYRHTFGEVLSGVKGQTFVAPSDRLSRIDVWIRTEVPFAEYIRVKFELSRGVSPRTAIVSGIVVFRESGSELETRLVFDPHLIVSGERLYLRMESILSNPYTHLYYAYYRQDIYPLGELLDRDRREIDGQDLRFKLYRSPMWPKPLAWFEAATMPVVRGGATVRRPGALACDYYHGDCWWNHVRVSCHEWRTGGAFVGRG